MQVRSTISDFAVFLTIMIMGLVDYLMGIPSPKLHVPDRFEVGFEFSGREGERGGRERGRKGGREMGRASGRERV